jgi:hypothetical protein
MMRELERWCIHEIYTEKGSMGGWILGRKRMLAGEEKLSFKNPAFPTY